MKYLVIVESPAKCKKIESFLGPDYKVCASYGHVREVKSLKNIDNDFNIEFSVSKEKAKYLSTLTKEIKKANEIIIASDNDREGEAIGWHICDHYSLPIETTKRIIFNEITKEAIQQAIKNPTIIDMNVVRAQHARQILDLTIGFKISPVLWKYINRNASLSAGRCQSPALKIIYDNHKEYMEQKPEFYYKTLANFTNKNLVCELNKKFEKKEEVIEFLELSKTHEHKFELYPVKDVISQPPRPFTTSTLQQTASNILHYSPKETMSVCQKLYEAGLITYMRTDSFKYANDFIGAISNYIKESYGDKFLMENVFKLSNKNEKKTDGAQEAHEAIRVTKINVVSVPPNMDKKMQSMYTLIRNHNLKTCMSPSIFEELKMKILAPQKLHYIYKTQRPKHLGWKIIDYTEVEHYFNYLQALEKTQSLNLNNINSKIHIGNTKSHLTEATLVNKLETMGIGRPSTFASIVEKLFERKYVKRGDIKGKKQICENIVLDNEKNVLIQKEEIVFQGEKKKIILETMGISVCQFLYEYYEDLFRFDYTKEMEDALDKIANRENNYSEICSNFKNHIESTMKEQSKKLPQKDIVLIDEKYTCVNGKYGLVLAESIMIDGKKSSKYHKIKDTYTYDEIKTNQDTLHFEDLVDQNSGEKLLGIYKENDVILKNGPYGLYVKYNNKNIPLNTELKRLKFTGINLSHIIDLLDETREKKDQNILKELNKDISIRTGKFGPYVYYKTQKMKKPKFISIKKVKELKEHDYNYEKLTLEILKTYL